MGTRQAKGIGRVARNLAWAMVWLAVWGIAFGPAALAAPQGESVAAGSATFDRSGTTTTITASNRAIINYTSFDVASNETVRFVQPSATATVLNRISSPAPTRIDGSLQANGIVYLVNRAGVIFGPSSVVNVGGLYASASSISDQDFLGGVNRFTDAGGPVTNQGAIVADAVHLIGKTVANHGSIVATDGLVTMVAGNDVILTEDVGSHMMVRIEGAGEAAAVEGPGVENTGSVQAKRGRVLLSAGDMYSIAARQAGTVEAAEVRVEGQAGVTEITGTIDATGTTGGKVTVTGEKVAVQGATIDASGQAGGGTILVGGGYQGKDAEVANAEQTFISADSVLRADAVESGDGGTIIVWADQATWFGGQAWVRGGAAGGDGGFVETSAKGALNVGSDAFVGLGAAQGTPGAWLLDPTDVSLEAATSNMVGDPTWVPGGGNPNTGTVAIGAITTVLNAGAGGVVTISTSPNGGANPGDITVTDAITVDFAVNGAASTATLTLNADGAINVNNAITLGTSDDAGDVFTLNLNATAGVAIGNAISNTSGNGAIVLTTTGTTFDNTGAAITTTGGAVDIQNTGAVILGAAINAGAGNVTIDGGGAGAASISGGGLVTTSGALTYQATGTVGTNGAALNAACTGTIAASSTTSGDIYIDNTGNATLDTTSAAGSEVVINNAGALNITGAVSAGTNGNVQITVTGADQNLTVGNTITAGTASGGVTLSATGDVAVGGIVTSTGGAIVVTGDSDVNGTGDVNTTAAINAGAGTAVLTSDTMSIGDTVTANGGITVQPADNTADLEIVSGAVSGLNLSNAEITNLVTTGTLTLGAAGGTGAVRIGNTPFGAQSWTGFTVRGGATSFSGDLVLPDNCQAIFSLGAGTVTFGANTDMTIGGATGSVAFNSADVTLGASNFLAVDGASGAVTFNTSGPVSIDDLRVAAIGASTVAGALTVTNDAALDITGPVATTGGNPISITASAGALTVTGTVDATTSTVALAADSMAINNTVNGDGGVTLEPVTATTDIGINAATGGLDLTTAELQNLLDAAGVVTVGAVGGTGAVNIGGLGASDLSGEAWSGLTLHGGAFTFNNTLTLPPNATATINGASVVGAADPGLVITGGAGTLAMTLTSAAVPSTINTQIDVLGAVTAEDDISITNDTSLNITGAVATTDDPVAISAGTGTLTVGNTIGAGAGTVVLTGDSAAVNAAVTGNGGITVQPSTVTRQVGVNATTGEFDLSTAELANLNSTGAIVLGAVGGSGAINIGGDGAADLSGESWTDLTLHGGAATFNNVLTLPDNTVATFNTAGVIDGFVGDALVIGGTGAAAFTSTGAVAIDTNIARLAASTVTGAGLTVANNGALLVTGNLAGTSVSLTAGTSGTGNLSFSGASSVSGDTISLRAGDGTGGVATAAVDAVTNTPTFQDTAGAATVTSFSLRQDAAIADATLPADTQFFGNTPPTNYSLRSDDGAAVTVNTGAKIAGSALTITGTAGADAFQINGAGATQTGSIAVNGGADDDVLTVNLATGLFLPSGGVAFNGQTQALSDSMVITGGAPTTTTYVFNNANDGTVDFDNGGGSTGTIAYTGLEPITDNSTVANRVFTFTDAADAIAIADSGAANDGVSQIASGASETVVFTNPTTSLTVNTLGGGDTITVVPDTAGGVFTPQVNVTSTGALTIDVAGVVVNAGVTVDAGGTLDVNGPITTTTAAAGVVRIDAGGYVHQNAAGIITADQLGVRANGEVLLTQVNAVDTFAAQSTLANANVQLTDAAGVTVGTVTDATPALWGADLVGLVTDGGGCIVASSGTVDLTAATITVGGDCLFQGTAVTSTVAGTITTTAGVNTGTASGAVSIDATAAGDMTGLLGAIDTSGADHNAATASAGGSVQLRTFDGAITTPAITTTGGSATAGNNDGGAGGDVNIICRDNLDDQAHNVVVDEAIDALGGALFGAGTAGAGGTVRIAADNNLTQNAGDTISAGSVGVLAGGSVTLDQNNQISVNTFAAQAGGSVTIVNDPTIAIGTVTDGGVLGADIDGITTAGGGNIVITSNNGSVIVLKNLTADNPGGAAGDITISVPSTGALRNTSEQTGLDPQYWHPTAVIVFGNGADEHIVISAIGSNVANHGTVTVGGAWDDVPGIATIWAKTPLNRYVWFHCGTYAAGQNSKLTGTGSVYVYAENATVGDMAAAGHLAVRDSTGVGNSTIEYLSRDAANIVRASAGNTFLDVFTDEGMDFMAGMTLNMPGLGSVTGGGPAPTAASGSGGNFRNQPVPIFGGVANLSYDEGGAGVRVVPDGTELWILDAAERGVTAASNLATALASALPGQEQDVSVSRGVDASQREDLVRHLGIYTKGPTFQELIDYLSGRRFFNDAPESNYALAAGDGFGAALSPADNKVSIDRLPADLAAEALTKYRAIYWQQVGTDPETGKPKWKSVVSDLRKTLAKSVAEYKRAHDGQFDPVGYRAWIASQPNQSEAANLMARLESLFATIELLGLGPVEQSISMQMLARSIRPQGLTVQQAVDTIRNQATAPTGGTVTASR